MVVSLPRIITRLVFEASKHSGRLATRAVSTGFYFADNPLRPLRSAGSCRSRRQHCVAQPLCHRTYLSLPSRQRGMRTSHCHGKLDRNMTDWVCHRSDSESRCSWTRGNGAFTFDWIIHKGAGDESVRTCFCHGRAFRCDCPVWYVLTGRGTGRPPRLQFPGASPAGSRSSLLRNPSVSRTTRPTYNRSTFRGNANTGGPLNFNYLPYLNGPAFYVDPYFPNYLPADPSSQSDLGLQGDVPSSGSRPNIRPRLDIADQNAMNSVGILNNIRNTVLDQIAQCAEKPFAPEWYAAHGSVVPTSTKQGNPWQNGSWPEVQESVGLKAEPQRYDFRPDKSGLIFVYRDDIRRERAVDARGPAAQLAGSSEPVDDAPPGLSLGVFAAVSPVDEPVKSLLHLVVGESGSVSGYQYDFSTDSIQRLCGALDSSSQRVAWQVGNVVAEAGLKNLTEDVARVLVFRDDGWTQAWILMRITEAMPREPAQTEQ